MADPYDPMKDPSKHAAPTKTLTDKVIELALGAGGGAVTLLSGLLAAVLILYSGYVLYDTFATERAASSNAWELLQFKPEILDDYETPLASASLGDINKDYRAWLTVYNTSIDYPVMQGKDDLYYAYHDIYKRTSLTGAIYLAAGNSADFSDSYNLIYGHHMESGAMFGALDHMSGSETGVIVTKDEIYDVQFFAVVDTDAYEGRIYSVGNRLNDVLGFLRSGGAGGAGVGTNVLYFNESVAEGATKVIALSTCLDAETSGRRVVFGTMKKRVVMTDVTIKKVWNDAENQDGLRPDSLTVTLSSGDTAELTEENGWTATLNVPKYDVRGEIPYTWTEETVEGYKLSDSAYDAETRTTTLTNSHTPATVQVSVRKEWNDDEDRDGIRPESVTAILSNGMMAVLNAENQWTAEINDLPRYAHGEEIEYTWTEEPAEGYTLSTEGNVLINSHEPASTALSVRKVWNDQENQDGLRPASVKVDLYGNDAPAGSVTLSESNQWTAEITGLYVYEAGQPIAYRWQEEDVAGYTLKETVQGTVTTLTNTHVPETVDLTVSKIWDDNDNQDGIRPGALSVELSNGRTVTLNQYNGWTGRIQGLPKYAAGQEIRYTWTEAGISGYEQTGIVTHNGVTVITNRHETDTTVATVVKVWEDDQNRDGLRPESITATLSNGQEVKLSEENGWTATVTGLPANADGQPISYTWTEEEVQGYTLSASVSGTITTLTNTHAPETTDLTVTKVWNDSDDQDGLRPGSLTVTLNADGEAAADYTLNVDNQWTVTAESLPVNADGRPITYSWSEQEPEGYTLTAAVSGTATTLTNTHIPATTSLTVTKVWEDQDNQDGLRPESLEVILSSGERVILTEKNGWTATIDGLPVYAGGAAIEYTWTEEEADGYQLTSTAVSGNTTVLTNTHIPKTVSLTVRKVWEDDNDRDALRTTSLMVSLLADGSTVHTVSLNAENGWTATADGMPVYADGEKILYQWQEESIAGYESDVSTEGNVTVLINTHTPETLVLEVRKQWEDDGNRDRVRPDSVHVFLKGDDGSAREVTLNEDNEWAASLEVPVRMRGIPISYGWTEDPVPGYSGRTETEGAVTTFINTHVPEKTERAVRKVWDDADDQDGLRPAQLEVYLHADNDLFRTVILNEENNWSHTADDLPVYKDGVRISYLWREERVSAYPEVKTSSSGVETVFTNIHVPETADLTVIKVWDDADNQDGLRPEKLQVDLLANGEKAGTAELSAENGWTGRITGLPVYANGAPITYVWDEGETAGYTSSQAAAGNTTVITNTHETERTAATVVKVWDDDNDRDGVRPASLTVTLNTGETVVLEEKSGWTGTVENLPRYRGGEEIEYTWTEEAVEGYEITGTVRNGTVTTITNHRSASTADRTVTKVWDDDNNRDGIRPQQLFVTLNEEYTVELNDGNNWTATVENLPVYQNNGSRIEYRWREPVINGYEMTSIATEGTATTLTNAHTPAVTARRITKVWADDNNRDGLRPATLAVTLNANGRAVRTVNLTAGNGWTATITDLPQYEGGTPVNYTWTEGAVPGYTLTDTRTAAAADGVTATTITNTHEPATIDLTVRKVWEDDSAAARPTTLNMVLTGSNRDIRLVTLSEANSWTATVTGLPGNDNGTEITYLWTEPDIAGYKQTSVVTTGNETVFTNTREVQPAAPEEYTLTIWYRYPDGSPAAPTYTGTYHAGDPYDVESPVIEGYRPNKIRVTGTMPRWNAEFIVIYIPEGETIYIDDFDTPLGIGQVMINVGDCLE